MCLAIRQCKTKSWGPIQLNLHSVTKLSAFRLACPWAISYLEPNRLIGIINHIIVIWRLSYLVCTHQRINRGLKDTIAVIISTKISILIIGPHTSPSLDQYEPATPCVLCADRQTFKNEKKEKGKRQDRSFMPSHSTVLREVIALNTAATTASSILLLSFLPLLLPLLCEMELQENDDHQVEANI